MFRKLRPHLHRRIFITIGAVLFILYAAVATLKVIGHNYELQQEVDHLKSENELLKLHGQELGYKVAYYKTDAYAEKAARAELGLQAPGEKVVIFPDKIPRELAATQTKSKKGVSAALSNFQQWLYFLFKKEPKS